MKFLNALFGGMFIAAFAAIFLSGVALGSEVLGMPFWAWCVWGIGTALTAFFALTSKPPRFHLLLGPAIAMALFYMAGFIHAAGTETKLPFFADLQVFVAWLAILGITPLCALNAAILRFSKEDKSPVSPSSEEIA